MIYHHLSSSIMIYHDLSSIIIYQILSLVKELECVPFRDFAVSRIWLTAKAGNGGEPMPNALRRPHLAKGGGQGCRSPRAQDPDPGYGMGDISTDPIFCGMHIQNADVSWKTSRRSNRWRKVT